MEKNKDKTSEKKGVPWWIIAIIILLIFFWFSSSDNLDEYSSCVDDCIYDVQDCMYSSQVYDNQRNAYIKDWDADSCISELEDCVSGCELDYGN